MGATARAQRAGRRAERAADQATDNPAIDAMARVGLVARGVVYVVVAWLAIEIGRGHGHGKEADRKGAIRTVAEQPLGRALLVVLAFGFAGYALWRLIGAMQHQDAKDRLTWLGIGVLYAAFAASTAAFLAGSGDAKSGDETQPLTARMMKWPGGRALVFALGAAVVVGGLVLAWRGVTRNYDGADDTDRLGRRLGRPADVLARVGNTARGLVFALAGGFIVKAAVQFDPRQARGLDGSLRALADAPAGPWLLGLAAAGLLAYGVSSFLEAAYRRI